jgi:coenzyme F420-reducing hydrogenase gamma subunit
MEDTSNPTPPTPPDAAAPVAPPPPTIPTPAAADAAADPVEASMSETTHLKLESCPSCHLVFAMSAEFYARQLQRRQAIFCPAGHGFTLTETPARRVDLIAENLRVNKELRQSRRDVERLRSELLRRPAPAPSPIDEQEFKRRVELLVNRAEREEYGKPVCRFCGKKTPANYRFKEHLKRTHAEAIRELPASFFD